MSTKELLEALSQKTRIVSLAAAARYIGGEANLKRLREAGWLAPFKAFHRDVQFDLADLDTSIERVKREGWPAPTPQKG